MTSSVTSWVWCGRELVECRRLTPGEMFKDGDIVVRTRDPRADDGVRVGRKIDKPGAEMLGNVWLDEPTGLQYWRPLFMDGAQ